MEFSNILLHHGEEFGSGPNPGSPEIFQTSNFLFQSVDEMRQALAHENEVPFYTRGTNPTVTLLNRKVAALEGTEDALSFASGSAAISAAVLANINTGDHILSISNPYSWSKKLFSSLLPRFGVKTDFAECINTEAFLENVTADTKIIYLESPNSWTFEMQDLEKITRFAKQRNITTILDNSYATPLHQKASDYGVDIIIHSATKYFGGHSDLVAGLICSNKEMIEKIFKSEYMTLGGIISPNDAWLLIRSLRTMPLRVKHMGESTLKVVSALESNEKIEKLYYPFSSHFQQKELVEKYLSGPNGMFTIDLKTKDHRKIETFCNNLRLFKLGCSWGSYESLAFPAITTVSSLNYDNPDVKINRIRFSVGLDEPELLIHDIQNALDLI